MDEEYDDETVSSVSSSSSGPEVGEQLRMSDIDDELIEKYSNVSKQNLDALVAAGVEPKLIPTMVEKLADYRYINTLDDLIDGQYIRWIKYPPTTLARGALLCYVIFSNNGGDDVLLCATPFKRYFHMDVPAGPIFQKLTETEHDIINIIAYMEHNNL